MPSFNLLSNINLAVPNERGGNRGSCPYPTMATCGFPAPEVNVLPHLPTTFDEPAQHWYIANETGNAELIATGSVNYGYVTGSAYGVSLTGSVGTCRYDAIYLSGSLDFQLFRDANPQNEVMIGAVDGAFTISGNNWYILFDIDNSEVNVRGTRYFGIDMSNQIISVLCNSGGPNAVGIYRNGVFVTAISAFELGSYAILQGVGTIRTYGQIFDPTVAASGSIEYNCLFGL